MTDLARVWIVPVDLSPRAAARCLEVLDDSERARAASFLSVRDRQQYTVAHGALRILAAAELRVTPSALRWDRGRYGKPELAAPWSGLSTSLSHSADVVAVAIACGRAVGVARRTGGPCNGGPGRCRPPGHWNSSPGWGKAKRGSAWTRS